MAPFARLAGRFRAELRASPGPPPPAALRLHRMMFRRFLREAGFDPLPFPDLVGRDDFLDEFRWSLDEQAADGALTPDVFGCLFDKHVSRKETGTFYTGRDVTDYIAAATIVPALLDAVSARRPDFLFAESVNDLVTRNVDLVSFAAGRIAACDDPHVRAAVRDSLRALTVLDPTCGCGEFLVAALRVLEPLYEACGEGRSARETILRHNLHGLDLMPEAVEITRMRLLLMLAASARGSGRPPSPRPDDRLRAGDALAPPDPFPRVARRGGFSVVLGNPPYVEVAPDHPGYRTARCGNLYAFVVERGLRLLAPHGRMGLIVPHSAFCTDRMAPLASLVLRRGVTWVSTYDIRPCKLFAGVDQRLAIFLSAPSP
ncbi:MAG TPA: DNA methyltransferase, partial [Gemmataceae bacterium]|nr:DNA methyltransferase [Gemmataceae bacterium]